MPALDHARPVDPISVTRAPRSVSDDLVSSAPIPLRELCLRQLLTITAPEAAR